MYSKEYSKSLLRTLVIDGGLGLMDTTRITDRLHELTNLASGNAGLAYLNALPVMAGVAMACSGNPAGLVGLAPAVYALYLGERGKITTPESKELALLNRNRLLINALGRYKDADSETLNCVFNAYESLVNDYMPGYNAIARDGEMVPVGDIIQRFGTMVNREIHGTPSSPAPPPCAKVSYFAKGNLGAGATATLPSAAYAVNPPPGDGSALGAQSETAVAVLNRTLAQSQEIGLPPELVEVVVSKPYSTFLFGQSEAGKDICLHNIMAALKARYPNAYFLGIDGKNHPAERPLWEIYTESIHISMRDRPADYHARLIDAIDRAIDYGGDTFISFSELNGIAASYSTVGMSGEWAEIAHRVAYLAIQGNAARKFLYATAQALNLDALGIRKDSRANCAFMAVANGTQFGFLSQISGNVRVFDNRLLLDQGAFQMACSRSHATDHLPNRDLLKGIAYFHSSLNRWEPMPRLHNPGSDRGTVSVPQPIPPKTAESPAHKGTPGDFIGGDRVYNDCADVADTFAEMLRQDHGKKWSLSALCKRAGVSERQRREVGRLVVEILAEYDDIFIEAKKQGNVDVTYFVSDPGRSDL